MVIAGGGGGIPVVREADGARRGLDAVIDKDLTSALMANVLGVEDMMILTAVPRVAVHFGARRSSANWKEFRYPRSRIITPQGHFPPGSMGPKIEAAIRFLEGGGKRICIAALEDAVPALLGKAGTCIHID